MGQSNIGRRSPLLPLDLHALRYESLDERPSKVSLADLGRPGPGEPWLADWLDRLPRVLGADALRRLCDAIVCATGCRAAGRGGTGRSRRQDGLRSLSGRLDRAEEFLPGLRSNGSAAIHDLELAIAGKTSEDVGSRLMAGNFGFARETSDLFALACKRRGVAVERAGGCPGGYHPRARRAWPRFVAAGGGASVRSSAHRPRRDRHRHRAHDSRARRGRAG